MSARMKVMILAAGEGRRMRPLTLTTPKPLLTVRGTPLIEHHIRRLVAAGLDDILINTAYLGGQIHAALGTGHRFGARLHYSFEGAQALETAGGIRRAQPLLGSQPFIIINADIWTDYPFEQLLNATSADSPESRAHLVLVPNPEHNPKGDFVLKGSQVSNPDEHNAPAHTYAGIARVHPALFHGLPPGSQPLAPLLRRAAAEGKVSGELYQGDWQDIGTPERLEALNQRTGG